MVVLVCALLLSCSDEASLMNGNLSGDDWTSTSITELGTTAWNYSVGGTVLTEFVMQCFMCVQNLKNDWGKVECGFRNLSGNRILES